MVPAQMGLEKVPEAGLAEVVAVAAEAEPARASGMRASAPVAAAAVTRLAVRRLMMRFRPGACSAKRPKPSGPLRVWMLTCTKAGQLP
jgi:hypothetical protein